MQKLALHESNISRYNAEFAEISTIGSGQFGSVHKCVNRLGEYLYLFLTKAKEVIHNYTPGELQLGSPNSALSRH